MACSSYDTKRDNGRSKVTSFPCFIDIFESFINIIINPDNQFRMRATLFVVAAILGNAVSVVADDVRPQSQTCLLQRL
jgi:hypothetical protein